MHESMFSWNNINSKMVSKKEMNMHLICSGCFLILKKMRKYHRHTMQQLIIPFERLINIQRYYAIIIKSIKHNRKDMKQNFNTQQFCVIRDAFLIFFHKTIMSCRCQNYWPTYSATHTIALRSSNDKLHRTCTKLCRSLLLERQ